MAKALELDLEGVHSVTESLSDNEPGTAQLHLDYGSSAKRSRYNADLGVEVRHSKEVTYSVTVLFRVTKTAP